MNILLSLLSGGLLFLSFPSVNMFLLSWIALVPLLAAIRGSKGMKDAFLCGLLCGLVFFGGVLYWVAILSQWAEAWAYAGYAMLVIYEALFVGVFAAATKYVMVKWERFELPVIPLLWVLFEWCRSLGTFGITGGGLGYTQADLLPVAQMAKLAGVGGISFLVVLVNVMLSGIIGQDKEWIERVKTKKIELAVIAAIILAVAGYGIAALNTNYHSGTEIKVAVVQASISQDIKLDYGQMVSILDLHELLSEKAAAEHPQLIIWPETSVTTYLNLAPGIKARIERLVRKSKAHYLIGTSYTTGSRNYNSVMAFSPAGDVIGRYDKQKLVPFGEYLLFRPLLFPLFKDKGLFAEDYHSNPEANIINLGIAKAGIVICFESTFPAIVRDKVKKGADFIVVATNDAWFGRSSALPQHIQSTRMRAIENGVYIVQAANTGISAIIDPCGRVIKQTAIDEEVVLSGDIFIKR